MWSIVRGGGFAGIVVTQPMPGPHSRITPPGSTRRRLRSGSLVRFSLIIHPF
jgi:hypothetical protein